MFATMYNIHNKLLGKDNTLLETDRIVEINGNKIFVHDNYVSNRRNIICHSNKLKNILEEIDFKDVESPYVRHILLSDILHQKKLDDIQIISVDGFY